MIYIKQNIEQLLTEQLEESEESKWFWMVGDFPSYFDPDAKDDWNERLKNRFHEIMEQLSSGELKNVLGVSESKNIIKNFFNVRNFYLQMPAKEFIEMNNSERMIYDDLNYFVKNNFYMLRRLYNNINDLPQAFTKLFSNNINLNNLKNNFNILEEDFKDISYYINSYVLKSGQYNLEKYIKTIENINFDNFNSFIDSFYNNFVKNQKYIVERLFENEYYKNRLDLKKIIIDILTQAFKNSLINLHSMFGDEKEIIINSKNLKIPKGSKLVFKLPILESNKWAENQKTDDFTKMHPYVSKSSYIFMRIFWQEYKKYYSELNNLYDIRFIDNGKYENIHNKKIR